MTFFQILLIVGLTLLSYSIIISNRQQAETLADISELISIQKYTAIKINEISSIQKYTATKINEISKIKKIS